VNEDYTQMADEEEKTETEETAPEPAEEQAAAPEPVAEEASADASEASTPEADAEPSAEPSAPAKEPDAPAEAPLAPKERKRRTRAAKFDAEPARPPRTPEERKAERDEARRRKATLRSGRRQREREKARAARGATPEPIAARPVVRPGTQKTRQGIVVSDKAAKTITVRIDVTRRHPAYAKIVRTSSTLRAHDENSDAHIGDTVVVQESRPLSRTKRWRLVEVVARAK
jgi:small subunit ribosomal protein S17